MAGKKKYKSSPIFSKKSNQIVVSLHGVGVGGIECLNLTLAGLGSRKVGACLQW